MATARDIISQAGRRVRILAGEEAFSAAEAADSLTLLNNLMFNFPPRGINYTHVALALSDAVTLPDAQLRNLVLLLAVEMMIDFGKTPNDLMITQATQAEQQLQAAYPMGTGDNTAMGVCYQAFRRLRMAQDGDGKMHPSLAWAFITAVASTDALRILNDMMFGFPARGINYTHTTLAAGDNVPIGAGNIRNLVLLLVKELGLGFGVPVPPILDAEVLKAEAQLQGAFPMGTADGTALGVCYQAFRRLRLATDGEGRQHPTLNWSTITLTASADALRILNDLMFALPSRGINYSHSTLAASDPVPIGSGNIRALVLLLVKDFAFNFGVTVTPLLDAEVQKAEQQLQAALPIGTADNTALGVCYQAFRRLRTAVDGEGKAHPSLNWTTISLTASADALRVLNDMMFALPSRGINYTHSTLTASDPVPIGSGNIRALVLLLVKEFAFHFGVPITPLFDTEVAEAEAQLQAILPIGTADNTALGVCYQVFRKLRTSVDGEGKQHPSLNWTTISVTASTDALRILNDTMFGFPARGINYTHSTLSGGDAVPIGSGNIRNLVLVLVREFATNFGVTTNKVVDAEIVKAEQQLQAAFPPTMDATVIGLINQALQRIRVFAGDGNGGPALPWYFVAATNTTQAVRMFNDMMHGLGPRGIYYAHATLTGGDTVNMPDEQIRNLILLLVKEFANANAVPLPPQIAIEIARAENALQAAYWVQPPADTEPMLRQPLRGIDIARVT